MRTRANAPQEGRDEGRKDEVEALDGLDVDDEFEAEEEGAEREEEAVHPEDEIVVDPFRGLEHGAERQATLPRQGVELCRWFKPRSLQCKDQAGCGSRAQHREDTWQR